MIAGSEMAVDGNRSFMLGGTGSRPTFAERLFPWSPWLPHGKPTVEEAGLHGGLSTKRRFTPFPTGSILFVRKKGDKFNGQVANAVMQVTSDPLSSPPACTRKT